jgi:phosphoglycolate phosphatase
MVFATSGSLGRPQMILIDLDGTLVDTAPDLARAVDAAMQAVGLSARGESRVRQWIGNGPERMLRRALVDSMEGEPDEALFRRAYPVFLKAHEEHICRYSRLFPGVLEGLDYLMGEGYPLGCVTNKPARFTEPLLQALGVRDRFGLVVSGDTLPRRKPDPLPLLHSAEFFGVAADACLIVGDSINDVQAARAAGFKVVCVTYGYNHGRDIREAAPDAVIDSLNELRDLLPPRDAAERVRHRIHDA